MCDDSKTAAGGRNLGIVHKSSRHIVADKGAARVEQGPQEGGQQGGARGQDLDEGALKHLVAVEAEVPQEPRACRGQQPAHPPQLSKYLNMLTACFLPELLC